MTRETQQVTRWGGPQRGRGGQGGSERGSGGLGLSVLGGRIQGKGRLGKGRLGLCHSDPRPPTVMPPARPLHSCPDGFRSEAVGADPPRPASILR